MASMRDVFADLKLYLNKNWLGCCYDILQSNNLPGGDYYPIYACAIWSSWEWKRILRLGDFIRIACMPSYSNPEA
eukprot:1391441-Amorphochlora_amoeboformis.AAC.2